jgi:hypothetical protein
MAGQGADLSSFCYSQPGGPGADVEAGIASPAMQPPGGRVNSLSSGMQEGRVMIFCFFQVLKMKNYSSASNFFSRP